MRHAVSLLRHPLKHPEWGEYLLAGMGLLQFGFALFVFNSLPDRQAMSLTVFFSPEAWTVAGLLLFVMHITALRITDAEKGHYARMAAASSSLAFWSHFIISIVVNAMVFGGPLPGTLVPALGTPLLAGSILFRLWRHW